MEVEEIKNFSFHPLLASYQELTPDMIMFISIKITDHLKERYKKGKILVRL